MAVLAALAAFKAADLLGGLMKCVCFAEEMALKKIFDQLFGTVLKPVPPSMARKRYVDGTNTCLISGWRYRPLFLGIELEKYDVLPCKQFHSIAGTVEEAITKLENL